MPPLDYVGTAAAAPASASAPSLAGQQPQVGDVVLLRGLQTANLNGERARILPGADHSAPRAQVKLLRTGKRLLVKWSNFERPPPGAAEAAESEESPPSEGAPQQQRAQPPASAGGRGGRGKAAAQQRSPEALMELMRQAMQSTTVGPVQEALSQVEAVEGIDWGELLPKKKQLLKKLRAKRRKLQPQGEDFPAAAESPAAASAPAAASPTAAGAAAGQRQKAVSQPAQASGSDKSSQSEKEWVVLGSEAAKATAAAGGLDKAAAAVGAAAAAAGSNASAAEELRRWCEELQLPMELLDRLRAEEVNDPQELTGVQEDELASFTEGWKIGPKGRFMKAVRRMRALEQAELGSTCGSVA